MVLAPALATAIYLFTARTLFIQDKTAYIFETSLSLTKAFSNELNLKILSTLDMATMFMHVYNQSSDKFNEQEQITVFNNNESFLHLFLLQRNKNSSLKKKNIASKPNSKSLAEESFLSELVAEAEFEATVTKIVDSRFYILKKVKDGSFLFLELDAQLFLGKDFNKSDVYGKFLINKKGEVLSEDKEILGKEQIIETLKTSAFNDGAQDLSSNGFESLVSYSFVKSGNFYVVTTIEKSQAFRAVSELLVKSVVFFFMILSGAFILGFFISSKITADLNKLTEATKDIAKGNFQIKLNIESSDEVGLLGNSFNTMAGKVSQLMAELNEYAKTLEVKVEQRTEELNRSYKLQKAMNESLGQGFLVVGPDGSVAKEHSKACESIFLKDVAGRKFADIFTFDAKESKEVQDWCEFLLEEKIPFEDLKDLGPKSFVNKKNRFIELDYKNIRNEKNKIEGIVVVSTDKTVEVASIAEAKKTRERVELLEKLLKNKNQAIEFLLRLEKTLNDAEMQVTQADKFDSKELFLQFHTLKGNALGFKFFYVAEVCHKLEKILSESNNQNQVITIISDLKNYLNNFKNENAHLLSGYFLGKQKVEVDEGNIINFAHELNKLPNSTKLVEIFGEKMLASPVKDQLFFLQDVLVESASRQNKKVNSIKFIGGDISVLSNVYAPLFSSFVHIVRNSITHGIEPTSDRIKNKKSEAGNISIEVDLVKKGVEQHLRLVFKDDGKGVDVVALREKLKQKNKDVEKMSNQEILDQLLLGDVSSTSQADLNSGRGVGVCAVFTEAKKLGGDLKISTEVLVGTKIEVCVPYIQNLLKSVA